MVSHKQKKAIELQNAKWLDRKPPKEKGDKRSHPWYSTDKESNKRIRNVAYQDIDKKYIEDD